MAHIVVYFIHPTGSPQTCLTVDDSITAEEALDELIRMGFLDPDPHGYHLIDTDGMPISPSKSFANAGVKDGARFRVVKEAEDELNLAEEEMDADKLDDSEDSIPLDSMEMGEYVEEDLGEIDLGDAEEISIDDELQDEDLSDEGPLDPEITTQELFGEELPTEEFTADAFPSDETSEVDVDQQVSLEGLSIEKKPAKATGVHERDTIDLISTGELSLEEDDEDILELTEDIPVEEVAVTGDSEISLSDSGPEGSQEELSVDMDFEDFDFEKTPPAPKPAPKPGPPPRAKGEEPAKAQQPGPGLKPVAGAAAAVAAGVAVAAVAKATVSGPTGLSPALPTAPVATHISITGQTQAPISIGMQDKLMVVVPPGVPLPCTRNGRVKLSPDGTATHLDFLEGAKKIGSVRLPERGKHRDRRIEPDLLLSITHKGDFLSIVMRAASLGFARDSTFTLSNWDVVGCSVFSPPVVIVGEVFLIQVFAHLLTQASAAEKLAKQFDGEAALRGQGVLTRDVARGSKLAFHLLMPDLSVEEPIEELVWRGDTASVNFEVRVPSKIRVGRVTGVVSVSLDGIPVGKIRFLVEVTGLADRVSGSPAKTENKAVTYENFFVSYASEDRPEVMKRVQMLPLLGQKFFQDILNLDPGDRWERKLYHLIDNSDAVLLFWSSNARKSEWVRRECRYAIEKKGLDSILPVVIEGPPSPLPWSEIDSLHFGDKILYYMGKTQHPCKT